jgi:hypothetical protein
VKTTAHRTPGDPAFADRINNTHAGQAHWAEYPAHTCRECLFWGYANEPFKRTHSGRLLGQQCTKFSELTGKKGPLVPHFAHACRFFEPTPDAPSVFEK